MKHYMFLALVIGAGPLGQYLAKLQEAELFSVDKRQERTRRSQTLDPRLNLNLNPNPGPVSSLTPLLKWSSLHR